MSSKPSDRPTDRIWRLQPRHRVPEALQVQKISGDWSIAKRQLPLTEAILVLRLEICDLDLEQVFSSAGRAARTTGLLNFGKLFVELVHESAIYVISNDPEKSARI